MRKPWRDVCPPHPDVLQGTFQQSEFAADITAVRDGKATPEYQDAAAFFERTFITEGMGLLLQQVAHRLCGKGGEPVIQLQTAFGGGKTHTMLAVYHMAMRSCPIADLSGVPALFDHGGQAGLLDVPRARVAVLDGTAHAPAQPWSHGALQVHTLWGELGWQLGGEDGYAMVRDADTSGTSPGKDVLRALLDRFSPCVILIDELVAYVRQFQDGQVLSGGSYDSNLSFVQALTEAAKLVPTAIVLGSLPESEVEAGGSRGVQALRALEKTFGRVQALWKPVASEEAFEIVRRRLFQPISDPAARDAVCRAFAQAYTAEGAKLPAETHEARYVERLSRAYPIHPEVFDRLYEDWTTLEGFQRTRGVLKLMARVIHRLWKDENHDLMILPCSLPLYDSGTRNEFVYHLPVGWDAVLERDIDGDRAETTELDIKEARFGAVNAARRVARTLFLGTAPASGGAHKGVRGLDRARVVLGCLQPGQSSSLFTDALSRLADRLHYLGTSGDKAQETTRYWFDTRANLRREMEERKGRINAIAVRSKIAEVVKKLVAGQSLFEGVHVFLPSGDVPDDGALRLVLLPPERSYSKADPQGAFDEIQELLKNNGSKPRYRGNRLVFIGADQGALLRLRDCACTALAWRSIVEDVEARRLNIDVLQKEQARKELETADGVVPRAARECFKWLLCPVQASPTDKQIQIEAFPLNTGSGSFSAEIERVCGENELVIEAWSPVHLRNKLRELYWKDGASAARAFAVWEDMQRYYYLPRLKRRVVLEQVILKGAASRDFFGTAYGQVGEKFEGFKLDDGSIQVDDTLLLIDPVVAAAYEAAQKKPELPPAGGGSVTIKDPGKGGGTGGVISGPTISQPTQKVKSFFGSVDVNAATAKMKLVSIAEELIALLAADPNATVKVTLEISAEFPSGAPEQIRRAVSENATSLGFKSKTWE